MPKSPENWIEIAVVARPHGVKGELRVRTFSEESGLIAPRASLLFRLASGEEKPFVVTAARKAPGEALLVKLRGVEGKDAADLLRSAKILVKRSEFPPLDEGEFYFCDLEGAEVLLEDRPFGTVKSVREYPSVDVLLVLPSEGGKAWEVPLTEAFVSEVDAEGGRVRLLTIEGCVRE